MKETTCLTVIMLWGITICWYPISFHRAIMLHRYPQVTSRKDIYSALEWLYCWMIWFLGKIPDPLLQFIIHLCSVPKRILLMILILSTSESFKCSSILISISFIMSRRFLKKFFFKLRWLVESKLFVFGISVIYFFQDSNVLACTYLPSPVEALLVSLTGSVT